MQGAGMALQLCNLQLGVWGGRGAPHATLLHGLQPQQSRVAGAVERCAHAAPPQHACAQVGPRDCLAAIRYVLRLAPTPLALVVQA